MINVMCGFDTTNKDVSITYLFGGEEVQSGQKNVLDPNFM